MKIEGIASNHAKFLQMLNEEFFLCSIVLKDKGIIFDTNHINYWSCTRNDETITISPVGIYSFKVRRNTNTVDDEIELPVQTNDYSKRYRRGDLLSVIGEGFGDRVHGGKETDLEWSEIERFFKVSEVYLNFLGENTEELLMCLVPRQLYSKTCADLLYEIIKKTLIRLRENESAVKECVALMKKYEELGQHDAAKFPLMLEGLETIAHKYLLK